jgi:hypothetical protein
MNPITRNGCRALASALSAASIAAGPAMAHDLPLGDGKISDNPRQGYVYSCQTRFGSNGPGAHASGAWLDEAAGTWDPDLKPIVDGSVSWPSQISISLEGGQRVIRSNGLPEHTTGTFPVRRSDDAYQYDRNPNSIAAQRVVLTLDRMPQLARMPSCVPMGMIGFALSGAAIYNALDARGDDAPAHEIQDGCNGHPERRGEYHYHNYSGCFDDTRSGPNGHSDLVGYALDGFGLYGLYDSGANMLSTDDLDECHGHAGLIEWDGELVEMYHYHFTEDYPYTLGCFAGQVSR